MRWRGPGEVAWTRGEVAWTRGKVAWNRGYGIEDRPVQWDEEEVEDDGAGEDDGDSKGRPGGVADSSQLQ